MQLAEDLTKEYIFDYDEWSEKTAYKAARRNAIIGVSEGLEELGLETQTAYTLGNAIGTDVNNMISGTSSALTNPFQNTFGAGVNYGISELGDSMGLNDFEMTGISIASEGLFHGVTGSNNFMTDFSNTINNQVSNTLHSISQNVINSQSFDADFGDMALSSYSTSLGAAVSHNMKVTFDNMWNSVKDNAPLNNSPMDTINLDLDLSLGDSYFGKETEFSIDNLAINWDPTEANIHIQENFNEITTFKPASFNEIYSISPVNFATTAPSEEKSGVLNAIGAFLKDVTTGVIDNIFRVKYAEEYVVFSENGPRIAKSMIIIKQSKNIKNNWINDLEGMVERGENLQPLIEHGKDLGDDL